LAAQNFGMEHLPPREQRYDMADEYVDLVCRLFDSWDADAVVMDRSSGTYADYHKVRPIHFEGKYFKYRVPLNTVRSPQGQPVFVQAGGSPRGRAFAARHADSIIAVANGIAGMKTYREDVRRHAERFGRNLEHAKVLFLVYPILAETDDEARAKYQRMIASPAFIERSLAGISSITDIDFSTFALDEPLPHLTTNDEQGSLDKFTQWGTGKTLRQLAMERFESVEPELEFIGSPDTVAERMGW
jgi:long-chain alkane monooxygenase